MKNEERKWDVLALRDEQKSRWNHTGAVQGKLMVAVILWHGKVGLSRHGVSGTLHVSLWNGPQWLPWKVDGPEITTYNLTYSLRDLTVSEKCSSSFQTMHLLIRMCSYICFGAKDCKNNSRNMSLLTLSHITPQEIFIYIFNRIFNISHQPSSL